MTDIPSDARWLGWDEVHQLSVSLADKVEAHCIKTGEGFDAMVVIPRGGYNPASIVSYKLGFSSVDLLHACIGTYAAGQAEWAGKYRLGQMPTPKQIQGKNLLIIEEVCDRGRTLTFLTDYLSKRGAALVRTGVLHYKPSQSLTGFKPDWAVETTEDWIVYPWEVPEINGQSTSVKRLKY
ncbi:MAG TPA: phosphoribosyltransferase family protein [Candidatus Saccharimonadales bacterium]|jgi:hypothetical protein|nr:phosphoribosyltransferase family protein [Candidatus Saccharimonadales bacterium]